MPVRLPVQVETRITCPLSAMQTFWYRRLLTRDSKMLTNIEAEDSKEKEVNVRCALRARPQQQCAQGIPMQGSSEAGGG